MPPALSIDTAQPRDVKKPLLFECAWEVANKGQTALSHQHSRRIHIGGHNALNFFYWLTTTDSVALIALPSVFSTFLVGYALLGLSPWDFLVVSGWRGP